MRWTSTPSMWVTLGFWMTVKAGYVTQMLNLYLISISIHVVYTVQPLYNFITCVNIHNYEHFGRKGLKGYCNTDTAYNSRSPHNAPHSPSWGKPGDRTPHLWIKRKIVYIYMFIFTFIYMISAYSVYAFCPICAWCNISTVMLYMLKDIAKLGMFESQKEVCTTHEIRRRERLRPRNQCDRDRRAAESVQQREAQFSNETESKGS